LRSGWPDKSQLRAEFDCPGTQDFCPWLLPPEVLRGDATLVDGGWGEVRRRKHEPALEARDLPAERPRREHGFEVPIQLWPNHPARVLRISFHLYNGRAEYLAPIEVLRRDLAAERS
jgi:hypothetical protein